MSIAAVTPQHISSLLKLSSKIPTVKVIISMDPNPLSVESKQIYQAWGEQVGIKIIDLIERKFESMFYASHSDGYAQWRRLARLTSRPLQTQAPTRWPPSATLQLATFAGCVVTSTDRSVSREQLETPKVTSYSVPLFGCAPMNSLLDQVLLSPRE